MNPNSSEDELVIQFAGGPLNGQESSCFEFVPEFRFARLNNDNHWSESPIVDIYVQLANTCIYIYKGTE